MSFYLGDHAAEALAVMTLALDEACKAHDASDNDAASRTARLLTARRIMVAADAGERDVRRLKQMGLVAVGTGERFANWECD